MKALLLLIAFLFPCFSRAAEQITIGDQKLTLPIPEGFSRYDGINAQADAAMQKSLPASKRMLMAIVPVQAADTAKAGISPIFDRQMLVETMRAIEVKGITAEQFSELTASVERTFDAQRGKAADFEASANKQFESAKQNWKMSETEPMGIYGKTANWVDYGVL